MSWFSGKKKRSSNKNEVQPRRGSREEAKRGEKITQDYIKEHVRKGGNEHDFDGI